ncbi:NAD-dependent epimerase/dehydratase family protein [Campylobacter lari]|nr:NAD-dependent epimerase/dehydratase family protein [Campylobacter lari]EAJ1119117.1 NAD-dependent epimerase/dehydratase family protein [Campylobacter lari]
MKNAIVFGATGYVGLALVKKLLNENISVLAIGRKDNEEFFKKLNFNSDKIKYLQINQPLEVFLNNSLKYDDFKQDCVLYHFAWSGLDRLTNGDIRDQIKNLHITSEILFFANKFGCKKFINVSSQEEAIFENYLKNNKWKNEKYTSSPLYYAGAKFANTQLVKLLSYLKKIDYINTRFSIVLDEDLDGVSFVASTFKKLQNHEEIPEVKNTQPCEIVLLDELVDAYYKIGLHGRHKADYYLGRGSPNTLMNYFLNFKSIINLEDKLRQDSFNKDILDIFDPKSLKFDTGFVFNKTYKCLAKEVK